MDVAEKIKIIGNGGGTSQSVLDSLTSLQDQINTLTGIDGTLGTMAQQDANAVAITGGTINGATVGATTPAAGTFTTLTANSTSQFGRSSANYVQAVGAASAAGPVVSAQGSDTNIDLNLTSKGTGVVKTTTGLSIQSGSGTFPSTGYGLELYNGDSGTNYIQSYNRTAGSYLATIYNASSHQFRTSGTEQFRVSHTASAVNYVQVTGNATGGGPSISAQGSDSNISMYYIGKGIGGHVFTSGNGGNIQAVISNTTSSVNWLQFTGAATGTAPVLSAQGSNTNIPLVLQPKGTGALQAQQTDSTATGGNARGANAVDWQTARTAASQVASSQYSVIGGGYANTSFSFGSVVAGGSTNYSSGTTAFLGGGFTNTTGGAFSVLVGGATNSSLGYYNFIGGGFTNSATSGSAVTTQSATMNGTTAVTLSGSNGNIKVGQYITGTSIAGDTYVAAISGTSLTLSKNASGSSTSTLSFFTPHGVVVGGGNNQATGSYSFIGGGGDAGTAGNRNVASGDWSVVAGGFKNTASQTAGFVGGGAENIASQQYGAVLGGNNNNASAYSSTILGGRYNQASGTYSTTVGGFFGATRSIEGSTVFSACNAPINFSLGVSQAALLILAVQTTDATATVLRSSSAAAGTGNQVILPNNSAYYFSGSIVAGVTGAGNSSSWEFKGTIKRGANAASTVLVAAVTPTVVSQDAGASTWVVAVTADTTNGGLAVTVTGQASTTIRWVAKIETTEMTF
jgi:hypothetical protein